MTGSKIALITGASTGIGYELAKLFAKDKWDLVLVARNQKKLEEVSKELEEKFGTKVFSFASDLSKKDSPEDIYRFTKSKNLFIEVLVNNAGYGISGYFVENSLENELGMLQVNIHSLVHLTKLYSQDMIVNKKGRILNVASTAAFQPGPYMSSYYATKAYVLSFSEGIREELLPKGITVSVLCPGPTITEFQKRADMQGIDSLRGPLLMKAEPVAKIGYKGMMSRKAIIIPGVINFIMAESVRFTPRLLVRKLVAGINKKMG